MIEQAASCSIKGKVLVKLIKLTLFKIYVYNAYEPSKRGSVPFDNNTK